MNAFIQTDSELLRDRIEVIVKKLLIFSSVDAGAVSYFCGVFFVLFCFSIAVVALSGMDNLKYFFLRCFSM